MQIDVLGSFRGITGYDRHTRCFIRELRKLNVHVRATHLEGWSHPFFSDADLSDITDHPDQSLGSGDLSLQFVMPSWPNRMPNKRNFCYTMFEANGVLESWVRNSLSYDAVIVPALSSKNAWIGSGFPEQRIRICPLGVDYGKFELSAENRLYGQKKMPAITQHKSIFLNVAELRPRKNHLGLIRAWISATNVTDDAVLILKINPLEPLTKAQFDQDILRLETSLGKRLDDAAPLVFISDYLPEHDMQALYAISTHYISMSSGEGWDLPMTEALASGLHVIAPFHSAYESYLNEEIATLIPAQLVPVKPEGSYRLDDNIWFNGLQWWYPDEAYAIDVIRKVINGSLLRIYAGPEYVRNNLSWESAAERLLEIIKENQ